MFSFLSNIELGNDSNFTRKIIKLIHLRKITTHNNNVGSQFLNQVIIEQQGSSVTNCS